MKFNTLLIDGWEDKLRRALAGCVAARVNDAPSVLGLNDMSGSRATADGYLDAALKSLDAMDIQNGRYLIAITTDNPTVMQAFCRKFQVKFPWVLAFPCFLHQLNTIIGKITAHPSMKNVTKMNTCIVNFFNSSHYWGGQLVEIAKGQAEPVT